MISRVEIGYVWLGRFLDRWKDPGILGYTRDSRRANVQGIVSTQLNVELVDETRDLLLFMGEVRSISTSAALIWSSCCAEPARPDRVPRAMVIVVGDARSLSDVASGPSCDAELMMILRK